MASQSPNTGADGVLISSNSVLRNRHFLLLWLAQAISQTAQNAIWFGLLVVVEETTHSTTQLGLAVLSTILPPVLFSLLAGAVVDRLNKKWVLVVTNLLRALVVLAYLLYQWALAFVFLANFLFAAISQFFGPAEAATIPALVRQRQLITANSFFNLTFTGSQLAGIVFLAPIVLKLFGPAALFLLISAIHVIAALLVSFLPSGHSQRPLPASAQQASVTRQIWREVREGWRTIAGDRRMSLATLHLALASALLLVMAMLAPRFVAGVLGIATDNAVYVFAPAGVGVLVGIAAMPRLVGRFDKTSLVNFGLFNMTLWLFALAVLGAKGRGLLREVNSSLWELPFVSDIALPLLMTVPVALLGVAFTLVTVPSQTILMEQAPVATRGRVFAMQQLLGNLASVLPLLFLGGLADIFGPNAVLVLISLVILLIAVASFRLARRLEVASPAHWDGS